MRGLIVFVAVICAMPVAFVSPFFGMMFYNWFALMKPEWLYGFPRSIPVAMLVAICTFLGWLFSKERKLPPIDATFVLVLLLLFWMTVTTYFSVAQDFAWTRYKEVSKIMLFALVMYALLTSPKRIQIALWVLSICVAFWGAKGGFASLLRGGGFRVFGPAHSVIEDNNNLGVALVTVTPLLFACRAMCTRAWQRHGMSIFIALTLVGTVFTYSRGAMLGAAAMASMAWLRSQRKALGAITAVVLVGLFLQLAPQSVFDRFNTIQTYAQDGSAQDRIYLWELNWRAALDRPIIGQGFNWMFNRQAANKVAAEANLHEIPPNLGVAHSIYFEVLGEHGFVGFALYFSLVTVVLMNALWLRRHAPSGKEDEWASHLGRMIPAAIVGYLVSGAFDSVSTYEGYYQLFIIVAAAKSIVRASAKATQVTAAPVAAPAYAMPTLPRGQV